jgi:hypothetical protein
MSRRLSLASLAASFAAAASAAPAARGEPAPLTEAAARSLSTAELAARFIGAAPARAVESHDFEAHPTQPPGTLPVLRFYTQASAAGDGLCSRRAVFVYFEPGRPTLEVQARGEGVQIALAPGCRPRAGGRFAWVQPPAAEAAAGEALLRLAAARNAARGGAGPRAVTICRPVADPAACAAGADAVLAALPLEAAYIVEPADTPAATWRIAVMPRGPGKAYWDVLLREPDGGLVVDMVWRLPSPF